MNGLAMDGAGKERLELFLLKKKDLVIPSKATFIAVPRGFGGVGLVREGCKHLTRSLVVSYRIQPKLEQHSVQG